MLDLSKDNTSRKRERARSQKIRRAVKRHEERVSTSKGRSNNPARSNAVLYHTLGAQNAAWLDAQMENVRAFSPLEDYLSALEPIA
ncbi:hypothetical protein OFN56_32265, partial [Escherichia coli]|nr:hypothetical protein [Escherichia coli]